MSHEAEVPSQAADIGWKLAQTREEKGLSVEGVAHAIHLRKHYVAALEAGRFEELPGMAYARGYVRRYAEFLELDAPALVAAFDAINQATPRRFFTLPQTLDRNPHPDARMVIVGLICAGVLMGWAAFARHTPVAAAVKPFMVQAEVNEIKTPMRCMQAEIYPPCFWENRDLWYQPSRPEKMIFAMETP